MFGSGVGTLRVKSTDVELWSKTGNQGYGWHASSINVPSTSSLKVIYALQNIGYSKYLSDMKQKIKLKLLIMSIRLFLQQWTDSICFIIYIIHLTL